MGDFIAKKAGICVELRDAITNRAVAGAIVKINKRGPAAVKEGRFHVFCEDGPVGLLITARADAYKQTELYIAPEEYTESIAGGEGPLKEENFKRLSGGFMYRYSGMCIISVFMYPGKDYSLPEGYVREKTECGPGAEARVVMDASSPLFLAEAYSGGSLVALRDGPDMLGRTYRIGEVSGEYEDFTVTGTDGGAARIDSCLSGSYARGSRVYRIYRVMADASGMAELVYKP